MSTNDSLTSGLRAAAEAVEAAGVPEDLRLIAFQKALDVTLGGGVTGTGEVTTPAQTGTAPGASGNSGSGGAAPMAKLAAKLEIEAGVAEQVFDIDEDGLHIKLSSSKLASSKKAATNEIARLVVAGRQAAGLDAEWTALEEVRSACEDRGKYDRTNFSKHVKEVDGDGFRIRGSKTKRELKAHGVGFETTGALVTRLVGQG